HPWRLQAAGGRDLRVAGGAAAERATFLEDRWSAGPVDRAVDATAPEQRRVGRVHDRVGVLLRDVAAHELDERARDRPSAHAYSGETGCIALAGSAGPAAGGPCSGGAEGCSSSSSGLDGSRGDP